MFYGKTPMLRLVLQRKSGVALNGSAIGTVAAAGYGLGRRAVPWGDARRIATLAVLPPEGALL